MKIIKFKIKSEKKEEFINITQRVKKFIAAEDFQDGVCTVFSPHTTAGITINESADPDVAADIIYKLDKLVPWKDGYRHLEGNSASHIKTFLTGSSVNIPVSEGRLLLGIWQGIYFCEYDGPRNRTFLVTLC